MSFITFVVDTWKWTTGGDFTTMYAWEWEQHFDQHPDDWESRLVYSDWLEEKYLQDEAEGQRYLANLKVMPGPPCALGLGSGDEATWFCAGMERCFWIFPDSKKLPVVRIGLTTRKDYHVHGEWCIALSLFQYLDGYIVDGRNNGKWNDNLSHSNYARSYINRVEAEKALSRALKKLRENKS